MKKLNKLVAILVALAMMMALAVTSAFAAPAKQTDGNAITNGTAEDPANIAIQKLLNIADGVQVPNTTFTFTVAATSVDAAKNPSAGSVTGYNQSVSTTVTRDTEGEAPNVTNVDTASGVTGYVLTGNEVYEKAGTYYFKVNEVAPAKADVETANPGATVTRTEDNGIVTITIAKDGVTETYKYDTTDHYIVAGVAAHKNADGTTTYYTNTIAVINPETKKEELKEVKVPVTEPGTETTNFEDGYAFTATNDYQKTEANALKIEKEVKGKEVTDKETEEANEAATAENQKFDKEKKFLFHVTFAAPSTSDKKDVENAVYNGVVKKADGTVVENKQFNANGTTDVELAHGWYVEFSDIEYGVTYSVTEDDYSAIGYTVDETTLADAVTLKDDVAASKLDKVTNIYDSTKDNTQTGLTLNNLPFIVLALVAIGGLVAYVVVRRRNADEA